MEGVIIADGHFYVLGAPPSVVAVPRAGDVNIAALAGENWVVPESPVSPVLGVWEIFN